MEANGTSLDGCRIASKGIVAPWPSFMHSCMNKEIDSASACAPVELSLFAPLPSIAGCSMVDMNEYVSTHCPPRKHESNHERAPPNSDFRATREMLRQSPDKPRSRYGDAKGARACGNVNIVCTWSVIKYFLKA